MKKMNSQIKSKKRVKNFAEVFTNEREVKAMCDLIPSTEWTIESKFLEPAVGEGAFLLEVFVRKLRLCKNEKDGLKALNSLFGIDIQEDNVLKTQENLLTKYIETYPNASNFSIAIAWKIVKNNIICDDFLNPKTEIAQSWGLTRCESYVKFIEKNKNKEK